MKKIATLLMLVAVLGLTAFAQDTTKTEMKSDAKTEMKGGKMEKKGKMSKMGKTSKKSKKSAKKPGKGAQA